MVLAQIDFYKNEIHEMTKTYFQELRSENTRVAYEKDWNRFLKKIFKKESSTITKEELETIDYETIIYFRNILKLANSSINRNVNTVKSVLTYLKARKAINIDLTFFDIVKPLVQQTQEIPHMPISVVHEYIEEAKKERFNGELKANLIKFAVDTGLRLQEILNIKLDDFQKGENCYYVSGFGKGNKKYRDKISIELYEALMRTYTINLEQRMFHPLSEKNVKDMMIRIRKNLGYEKENYSFHSLRKTSITYAHDMSGSLLTAQRKANHSSPATTNIYIEDRDLEMTGYFSTKNVNPNLFKEVMHEELIQALEDMPSEFLQILNNKLQNK